MTLWLFKKNPIFFYLLIFLVGVPVYAATSGALIAYWNFDEGEGSITRDLSGNGHNGLLSGGQWTPGIFGSAVFLDGTDDFVEIPADEKLSGMERFTVELWMKVAPDAPRKTLPLLNVWGVSGITEGAYSVAFGRWPERAVSITLSSWNQPYYDINEYASTAANGRWHHLVIVYTGKKLQVYTDGLLTTDDSTTVRSLRTVSHIPLLIGKDHQGNHFRGVLDEIRILKTAFSAEDVAFRYSLFVNHPAVADAGQDRVLVKRLEPVQLDGSKSWDRDGDSLSFYWSIIQKPPLSAAQLHHPSSRHPVFIPDSIGTYQIVCMVSDSINAGVSTDTIQLSFAHLPPIVSAPYTNVGFTGQKVTLDASRSYDLFGRLLTFSWNLLAKPDGSNLTFSQPSGRSYVTVTPDMAGRYLIELQASSDSSLSKPVILSLIAASSKDTIATKIIECIDLLGRLPEDVFVNRNIVAELTAILGDALVELTNARSINCYDKLFYEVSIRMDGCAGIAQPDTDDWIVGCDAQDKLYSLLIDILTLLDAKR